MKGEYPQPGIRYCKHWGDHAGMGIAVLVAARPDLSEVLTFVTGEDIVPGECYHLSAFAELLRETELVIGFNTRAFDCKVLASKGIVIPQGRHLDFYHEIKKTARTVAPKGYRMDLLSQRCGGPAKSDDGGLAPIYWQRGERQRVIDYCKNDITMLTAIASYYANNGARVPCPEPGNHLQLRHPVTIALEG